MGKHTPGPWTVDEERRCGGYSVVAPNGRDVVSSVQRDEHPLFGQGISDELALTNARLIAAAPDLLAVAINSAKALRLSGYLPDLESDNPVCWLLHMTERAIAKATGGSDE